MTTTGTSSLGAATVVLSLRGVSKRYGPVKANDNITVEFRAGEIHALLGENGSGKSTILGIASGTVVPDSGEIEINGRPLTSASPIEAMRLGLGIAYQTMTEVPGLTIAENLFLAAPVERRPKYGQMEKWAAEQLARYELPFDPAAPVESLTQAQRQMLEVVQSLLSEPRVLLLDEPTTALGHADVERLHTLIRSLATQGVGVVYVSHRLPEVLDVASRVTVLRDGVGEGTYDAKDLTETDVVTLMIGRPMNVMFPESGNVPIELAETAVEVRCFGGKRFGPINLDVKRGEIVGIAGAEGNGQVPFLRALAGAEASNGEVRCGTRRVDVRTPAGALRAGIVLLSADRKVESIFTALGVRANATLQVLPRFSRLGFVRRRLERRPVNHLANSLHLKSAGLEQPALYLSGGNQQKVALMRPFMRGELNVILADEPTQGVDVGARLDIYRALRAKADEGTAIIVKSSDPIELAGLCNRVVVMSRGVIVGELAREELSERRIIAAIIGNSSADGSK